MAIWFAVGLPAAYVMGNYSETTLSDAGVIVGPGRSVVLKPETWIGRKFPLLSHINIGEKLKDGKWIVLLYHYDCPNCRQIIDNLPHEKLSEDVGVALVQVPPYRETKEEAALLKAGVALGRLDEARDWLVTTPTKAWLEHGEVTAVTVGSRSLSEK